MRSFMITFAIVSLCASVSYAGYPNRGYNNGYGYNQGYNQGYYGQGYNQYGYGGNINVYQQYYPQNYWPGGNSFPIQGPPRAFYRQQQNSYFYRGR